MYVSITPLEWYRKVIFGGPGPWTICLGAVLIPEYWPGFHSGYSALRSRIAGIYSGIHSYSGLFPNERALSHSGIRKILSKHFLKRTSKALKYTSNKLLNKPIKNSSTWPMPTSSINGQWGKKATWNRSPDCKRAFSVITSPPSLFVGGAASYQKEDVKFTRNFPPPGPCLCPPISTFFLFLRTFPFPLPVPFQNCSFPPCSPSPIFPVWRLI